jgi:hypothetical protein
VFLLANVFCVKILCLSYFNHVKEVFKSSWHLLLRVWWPDLQTSEAKCYPAHYKMLHLYLGCKVGHQDKRWAPHICCLWRVRFLTGWVNGSRQMPFAVPMVWGQPKRTLVQLLQLLNIDNRDHDPKTNSEMSRFTIGNEFCPTQRIVGSSAFFLGGRRGTRTPKHFVNLTGESKKWTQPHANL